MLKRLELVGFKSFAEKTAFDFSSGITAIVGPNGSGKSNVVDAVRWVLGEQSAKSLRGGEMADVIFNGSTTRRSLGLAEVTMTFDNRLHSLVTELEEVQITRRVYRSGEGEYLINQQPSRLKDIKDLFMGSGAGVDAYCIIEQGRVDNLLQASTKERRTIFEEAAGISRFKAKKIETLRKLERVDQNLERLRDIIDEVEKQLRNVKLQASKAQRYQEYSERLKQLRVSLGLREFAYLAQRLEKAIELLDELRRGLADEAAKTELWENELRGLQSSLEELDRAVHEQEDVQARARQRIAEERKTVSHEQASTVDLVADLARTTAHLAGLKNRVTALAQAALRHAEELDEVETDCQQQREGVARLEDELRAAVRRHSELQERAQADKLEHFEEMRRAGRLQNDAVSFKAQVDNLRREHERLRLRTEAAAEHLASIDIELQGLSQADEVLQARLVDSRQTLAGQRLERERLVQIQEAAGAALSEQRANRSGLASRMDVLEGLERSHEGLGTGVREVFALLESEDHGKWHTVVGMVADLLTVRREYAPLIDLALADRAQRFLVRDMAIVEDLIRQRPQPFSGRVSFLPVPSAAIDDGVGRPNRLIEVSRLGRLRMPATAEGIPQHPGVVALAEQLVTCDDPGLHDLPAQLLGQTLIVRDLAAAHDIAAHTIGFRFVTLQGELLEADGTLTAGMHHAETGILSRKSELRELRQQAAELDRDIAATEGELARCREQLLGLESRCASLQEEIDVLAEQASDLRSRIGQHRQRREGLHEEVALSRSEISGVEEQVDSLDRAWRKARTEADAADKLVQTMQARLAEAERAIHECEHLRQLRQQDATAAKIALAKVEERLTALRARHDLARADLEQRRQELDQAERHVISVQDRVRESQQTMLSASAALAEHYLAKEAAESRLADLTEERDQTRRKRQSLDEKAQAARAEWQSRQELVHAHALEVYELEHRRETLLGRLHEDYQLDLAALHREQLATPNPVEPAGDTTGVNQEIDELRRKLGRLGSVNLDSLQELAELETRASSLQLQFDDLVAAKRSLEEIIGKINEDSRRLFGGTLAAIRTHFQELFRKLFGGGMADIVLEDETDILESGIEIIARPPGKELRSISLMSGGEKTMTAVALLLAIFRSKPSPFCILDEVDAALDEANIGRFTAVLREFLDRSHFILITHSKRTMAMADVLYGITMQESGVSKRVSVRFQDWPEDSQTAVA